MCGQRSQEDRGSDGYDSVTADGIGKMRAEGCWRRLICDGKTF